MTLKHTNDYIFWYKIDIISRTKKKRGNKQDGSMKD